MINLQPALNQAAVCQRCKEPIGSTASHCHQFESMGRVARILVATPKRLRPLYNMIPSKVMKGSVLFAGYAEEVRHGDITIGVKRVECNTVDKYSVHHLRSTRLPLLFEICTSAGPVDAHEVQSSNSNTNTVYKQSASTLTKWGADQGPWCSHD